MEQRGSILLLGDENFQTGEWLETAKSVSAEVAGASLPDSIQPGSSIDVVITNLSFNVPLDKAFQSLKSGKGERILVVALPAGSPYSPQELAEKGAHYIFQDQEIPKHASSILYEALRRVKPRPPISEGVLESRFEFKAQDYRDDFRKLALLDSLEALSMIDRKTKLRLLLAYQEALANAVEHGCLGLDSSLKDDFDESGKDSFSICRHKRMKDPSWNQRKVFVEARWSNGLLEIIIEDEGVGFLKEERSNSENLSLHGRGIGLIYSLMDDVEYGKHGRKLVMRKRLSNHGA